MNKNLHQLQLCDISGGTWIDAGCGSGTYTFPLATLVERVIGIDKSSSSISYLKNRPHPSNISFNVVNFESNPLHSENVDGILFAFSLHYMKQPINVIKNAVATLRNPGGEIVIIEYTRTIPVSWVPYPFHIKKLKLVLSDLNLSQYNQIFENDRYYMVKVTL